MRRMVIEGDQPSLIAHIVDTLADNRDEKFSTVLGILPNFHCDIQFGHTPSDWYTVIHFYFGADLILVISVHAFFPKLNLHVNFATAGCGRTSQTHGQSPPKFSTYWNREFSLYRKLYATEIKVD